MSDTIRDMSLELLELRDSEEILKKDMQMVKAGYTVDIEMEWEDTKDSSLSNQTKRNAAVEGLLLANESYQQMMGEQMQIHRKIQLLQIDLDFERREFQRNVNAFDDSKIVKALADICEELTIMNMQ